MKAFTKRALLLTLLVLCLFGVTILGASAAATVTAGVTEKVDGTTYVASFDFVEGETTTTYWYTDLATAVAEATANSVSVVNVHADATINVTADMPIATAFVVNNASVTIQGPASGTVPTVTYTGETALFTLKKDASITINNVNLTTTGVYLFEFDKATTAIGTANITLNNADVSTDKNVVHGWRGTAGTINFTVNGGTDLNDPSKLITTGANTKIFDMENASTGDGHKVVKYDLDNVAVTGELFRARFADLTMTLDNCTVDGSNTTNGQGLFALFSCSGKTNTATFTNCDFNLGANYFNRKSDAGAVVNFTFVDCDIINDGSRLLFHVQNTEGTYSFTDCVLTSASTGKANVVFGPADVAVTGINLTMNNVDATNTLALALATSAGTPIPLTANLTGVKAPVGCFMNAAEGYTLNLTDCEIPIAGRMDCTAVTAADAALVPGLVALQGARIGEGDSAKYYSNFAAALAAAKTGDTIYLLADFTISATTNITKGITIEGTLINGAYPTMHWTGGHAFKLKEGCTYFTMKNVIISKEKKGDIRLMDRPYEGLTDPAKRGDVTFNNVKFNVTDCSYIFNTNACTANSWTFENCDFTSTGNSTLVLNNAAIPAVTVRNCNFTGNIWFQNGTSAFGTYLFENVTISNNAKVTFIQAQANASYESLTFKNVTVSNSTFAGSNGKYFLTLYGKTQNVYLENLTWDISNDGMMIGCLNNDNTTNLTMKNMVVNNTNNLLNLKGNHTLNLTVIGGTYNCSASFLYVNDVASYKGFLNVNFNKDSDTTTTVNFVKRLSGNQDYNAFICTCHTTVVAEVYNVTINSELTSDFYIIKNRKYQDETAQTVSVKFVDSAINVAGTPFFVSAEDTLTVEFANLVMVNKAKAYEFGAVATIGNAFYTDLAAAAADAEEIGGLIAHTFFLNDVEIAIYLAAQTDLNEVAIGEGAILYYVNGSDNYYYNNLQAAVTAAPAGTTIIFVTDRALSKTAYINKQLTITAADGVVVTLTNGTSIPFVFNNGADVTFKNLTFTLANRLGRIDGEVTAINFVNCVINYAGDYFLYSNDTSNDPVTPEGGTPISKTMNVVFDENTVVTGTAGMGIWINTPQITKNSRFIFKGQFSTTTAEEGALVFILDTAAATIEIYPTAVLTGSIFNPNGALIYRVGGAVNDDNAKDFGVPLKATDATGVYYTNDYFFAYENLIAGEKIYEVPLTAEHSDKEFNINNGTYTVNTANVVDFLFTMFPNLVRINDEVYYANLAAAIADYQTGDIIYILKDTVIIDTSLIDGKTVIIAGLNLGTTDAPVYPTISAGVNIFAFANGGSLTLQNLGVALSGGRIVAITEAGAAGALVFDNVHFTWIGSTTLSEPAYFMSCNGGFPTSLTIKNSRVDTPRSEKGIWVLFLANAEGLTVEVKDSVINAGVLRIQGAAIATLNLTGVSAEVGRSNIVANYGAKDLTVNVTDCALNVTDPSVSASFGSCFYYSGDYVDTKLTTINIVDSIIATGSQNANNYGYMFSVNGIAGSVFNLTVTGSILTQVNKACGIVYAKHTDVSENIAGSDTIVNISITDTTVTSAGGFITAAGGKDNDAELIDNVININENTVLILNTEGNGGTAFQIGNNSIVNINTAVTDGANDPVIYVLGQENVIDNQNNGYVGYFGGTTELNVYGGTIISTNGSDYIFAAIDSASITVYGGYLQHNGYAVMRAYGVDPTITIYGGTFVLEATHKGRGSQTAMSVIEVGASSNRIGNLYIYGGIFVNNNDAELAITGATTSRQVIYKSATGSTVVIEGGVFLATSVQDYFYYTAGNSGAGISLPVASAPILKGASPVYNFAGRDCYLYSYNMGTPVAPELDSSVTVRLYTDGEGNSSNGLRFTSSINDVIYGALISWVQNLAVEAGLQPNDYVLSFGTLVAPLDTLVEAGGFSVEAFEAAGIDAGQYVDIAATEKGMTIDENGLEIRVALVDIDPENYDKLITARPYVTVTLIEGGAEAADGTEPVSVTSYYGTFNTNKGASSISRAALRELNDVMAIRTGAYQYKSVTVEGGFSRYSKAQQEALLTFVAHKHNFNFKGECIDEGCDYTGATVLDVDDSTKIYCEYGGVSYITVNLEAGITYNFAFSRNIVRYALYDANGNDCTVSDNKFACTADGVYHMVITSTGIGSTELTLNHVHQADHTGYCSICEEDLSILVDVEENYQQLVTDGMTYYYAIELTGGVSYTVLTKNGYYTLYNEAGQVCTIVDGITFACPEDGTYYLTVVATFSATGGITVTHNHDYDYQGYCKIDYCDAYIGQSINLYQQIGGLVRVGDEYRLAIELEAGENYPITFTAFMGVASLYDAEGNKMELSNDGSFNCTESGTYYVSVSVQTDTTAYVYVAITHECEYDFKGVCGVCGDDVSVAVTDPYSEQLTVYAGNVGYYKVHTYKDTKYILSYPADVISVKLYTDNGEVTETDPTADVYFDPTTGTYFNKNEDGTIYVVATVLQDAGPVVGVAHVHEYDFKGDCTVTNCGVTAATSIKSFNSAINATWVTGETYYYSFYMTAGRFYNVVLEGLECDWVVKNGENVEIFQDDAVCFTLGEDATCYLIVTATADAEGKIKITEAATHAIDFTGDCTVEGCEYDEGREITITEDATVTSYNAEGGQTLYASVQLAEGYTYTFVTSDIANAIVTLYDAQGNVIIPDANNAYTGNNATVYIQILVIGAHEGTLTITRTAVAAPAPAPAA